MTKYHVNKEGQTGKCGAQKGGCPFGGESGQENHFSTEQEARDFYETKNQDITLKSFNKDSITQKFFFENEIKKVGIEIPAGKKYIIYTLDCLREDDPDVFPDEDDYDGDYDGETSYTLKDGTVISGEKYVELSTLFYPQLEGDSYGFNYGINIVDSKDLTDDQLNLINSINNLNSDEYNTKRNLIEQIELKEPAILVDVDRLSESAQDFFNTEELTTYALFAPDNKPISVYPLN